MVYPRILSVVLCAIQKVLAVYLFHIYAVYLSIYSSSFFPPLLPLW